MNKLPNGLPFQNKKKEQNLADLTSQVSNVSSQLADKSTKIEVNIKDLGAKGDYNGTTGTDDTSIFQNAVNSLTNGGVMRIPAGNYKITSTITVGNNITIIGINKGAVKITGVGSNVNTPIFKLKTGSRIEQLYFKGAGLGVGIDFDNTDTQSDIIIDRCYFDSFTKGIYISQATNNKIHEDITITRNTFDLCTNAIFADRVRKSKFLFNYCNRNSNSGAGISFYGGNRNIISYNKIVGGKTGISIIYNKTTAGYVGSTFGNIITHNTIEGVLEESIGLDVHGNDTTNLGAQEIDTVASTYISGSSYGINLINANWSTAGGKYFNFYVTFSTGKLKGTNWLITSHNNAQFVLEGMRSDILTNVSVGDEVIIGQPMFDNIISNNFINASTGLCGISLWGFSYANVITENVIQGTNTLPLSTGDNFFPAIRVSSLNGLGRTGNTVPTPSGQGMKAPSERNIIKNNKIIRGDIYLNMTSYGTSSDYYSYGNIVEGNIVEAGNIQSEWNDDLIRDNVVVSGNATYTNTSRPNTPQLGKFYYDKTLNKPIWFDGTNWKDSTGVTV